MVADKVLWAPQQNTSSQQLLSTGNILTMNSYDVFGDNIPATMSIIDDGE